MSSAGARATRDTFDQLNIEYEKAYGDNQFKKACVDKAISILPSGARVLDVGCGTGVPVSDMLAKAQFDVVGFDISPEMIKLAQDRVQGLFTISDMLDYEIPGKFDAIFMIFAHLALSYADFHSAAYKYATALQPGGILVLGQKPSDKYVKDDSCYDETKAYVEGYEAPFMGDMVPALMLSVQGQRDFLLSMGLDIIWDSLDTFQPRNKKCALEEQQYIIAQRPYEQSLVKPEPFPKSSD